MHEEKPAPAQSPCVQPYAITWYCSKLWTACSINKNGMEEK